MTINTVIFNYGNNTEIINVTMKANTTTIATISNIDISRRNCTAITFQWDAASFAYGYYTISVSVAPVLGEDDTGDNTMVYGMIIITIPGDVNGDRTVDVLDRAGISAHWSGPPTGPLGYDANFDINGDGRIDVLDRAIASAHWGQHW